MDFPINVPGVGLVGGKFADEDPASGRQGSLIPADWGNSVTEEILNVIRAGNLEPSEQVRDQLLKAIRGISGEHAHKGATQLAAGFMSPEDKKKLDGIAAGATALSLGTTADKAAAGNHGHGGATQIAAGFMSAEDKKKLDSIAAGAAVGWVSKEITEGWDLNLFLEEGPYHCTLNAIADTLRNCPVKSAFSMRVWRTAGVIQELTEYMPEGIRRTFQRAFYFDTWSRWSRFYTEIDPPPDASSGQTRTAGPAINTWYQNTTGKRITVGVYMTTNSSGGSCYVAAGKSSSEYFVLSRPTSYNSQSLAANAEILQNEWYFLGAGGGGAGTWVVQ